MARPRNAKPALLGLAVLLLVPAPARAIDVPQTREEFVAAVVKGSRGVRMETIVVERSFDEVYKTFEARTRPCLDQEIQRTAYVGYVERSSSDYNPGIKKVGADRAEFTLQVVHRPRGVGHTPPPGGLYIMAANFRRAAEGRTEIVLYRPSMGFKDITKRLIEWAEGGSTECPKLR